MAERIAANCKKLTSIIKTIVLCGHQNIALRGHWDSAIDLEMDTSRNRGNFWALLQFRVDAGDIILQEHLSTASGNATYMSSNTQSQLIDIIRTQIQHKILHEVRRAKLQMRLQTSRIKSC